MLTLLQWLRRDRYPISAQVLAAEQPFAELQAIIRQQATQVAC